MSSQITMNYPNLNPTNKIFGVLCVFAGFLIGNHFNPSVNHVKEVPSSIPNKVTHWGLGSKYKDVIPLLGSPASTADVDSTKFGEASQKLLTWWIYNKDDPKQPWKCTITFFDDGWEWSTPLEEWKVCNFTNSDALLVPATFK